MVYKIMYELEDYNDRKEWRSVFWDKYDSKTKEEHPESNPNFVQFNRGFLKRLKPEKCNMRFLYNKYIELRSMHVAAYRSLSVAIVNLFKDGDTVIIPNTGSKNAIVHVLRKENKTISGKHVSWSISFEHVTGISSWKENPHLVSDRAREYSRLYKREYLLGMASRDVMSKICNLMKYKIEKEGVANVGLFYEELDGQKLMFSSSGKNPDSDYCECVTFLGVFSDDMNIDNVIKARRGF